jgi:hypothetical protein
MKLKLIFLLVVTATAAALFAQNPNTDYRFGIKLYNLATYDHTEELKPTNPVGFTYNHVTTENVRLLHPALAFQWRSKKNNFHEIELTELKWDNTATSSVITNDSIKLWALAGDESVTHCAVAARYEYILMLGKKKERKLVPAIGFAGSPYYSSYRFSPEVSASFPQSRQDIGLRAFVVPRLTWYVKDRIFFDLNLPVCIANLNYSEEKSEDPALPSTRHDVQLIDMRVLPKYFSARIGIGIKI